MGRCIPKRYHVTDKEDVPDDSDTSTKEFLDQKLSPAPDMSTVLRIFFCHNVSVSVLTCISIKALRCYILEQGKPKETLSLHFTLHGYERFSGQLCSLPTHFPVALRLCQI